MLFFELIEEVREALQAEARTKQQQYAGTRALAAKSTWVSKHGHKYGSSMKSQRHKAKYGQGDDPIDMRIQDRAYEKYAAQERPGPPPTNQELLKAELRAKYRRAQKEGLGEARTKEQQAKGQRAMALKAGNPPFVMRMGMTRKLHGDAAVDKKVDRTKMKYGVGHFMHPDKLVANNQAAKMVNSKPGHLDWLKNHLKMRNKDRQAAKAK